MSGEQLNRGVCRCANKETRITTSTQRIEAQHFSCLAIMWIPLNVSEGSDETRSLHCRPWLLKTVPDVLRPHTKPKNRQTNDSEEGLNRLDKTGFKCGTWKVGWTVRDWSSVCLTADGLIMHLNSEGQFPWVHFQWNPSIPKINCLDESGCTWTGVDMMWSRALRSLCLFQESRERGPLWRLSKS